MSNAAANEYTIDELAAKTRVPSRTIHFYRQKGALPKPTIRGRLAIYDDRHVERLELIAKLQDRGLSIRAIRELLDNIDRGHVQLAEWLGLEEKLRSPWVDDRPLTLSAAELDAWIGDPRPGLVAELEAVGVVRRQGDAFTLPSPALARIVLDLEASGISPQVAAGGAAIVRKHLRRAAQDAAKYFVEHAGSGFGQTPDMNALAAAFDALKPLGLEAVNLIFSHEIARDLRSLVQSGKAGKLTGGRKAK